MEARKLGKNRIEKFKLPQIIIRKTYSALDGLMN